MNASDDLKLTINDLYHDLIAERSKRRGMKCLYCGLSKHGPTSKSKRFCSETHRKHFWILSSFLMLAMTAGAGPSPRPRISTYSSFRPLTQFQPQSTVPTSTGNEVRQRTLADPSYQAFCNKIRIIRLYQEKNREELSALQLVSEPSPNQAFRIDQLTGYIHNQDVAIARLESAKQDIEARYALQFAREHPVIQYP